MTSRPYLAVAIIALVAAAGWGAYELRKRAPVAPASTTMARVSEAETRGGAPDGPTGRTETRASTTVLEDAATEAPPVGAKLPPAVSEDATATTPSGGAASAPATVAPVPEQDSAAPPPGEHEAAGLAAPRAFDAPEQTPPSAAAAPRSAPAAAARATPEAAPDPGSDVGRQPRPASVTERIRRALSALFGGAVEAPVSQPSPEDLAAVPPASQGADQDDAAEIEPEAAPSFDVVRIGPGGGAVIAGRAAPEAEVELRSGARVIDRVRANRRGEWVALPPEPLPGGDQELTVAARVGAGPAVESNEVLVVAVPEPAPQPAPRAAAAPSTAVDAEPPTATAAGVAPSGPLAVALPKEGGGQGRILQAPGRISTDGNLALMVLDYDDTGRIRLGGEALPGAPLRVYVDNQPAAAVTVGSSGQWSTVLEGTLAPGDYTLRLDQLDPSGKPTARLETPFTRVSQPPVEGDVQVDFVIVQPGNSLWRIARRLFGEGVHYVHIYDANQGQIRDPDLIYPGQVFEIPGGVGASG